MSSQDPNSGPGYGVDIEYKFEQDGSIDFVVGPSGDIKRVGGIAGDLMTVKRRNARQQIVLRLLTNLGVLREVDDRLVNFGSSLYMQVGAKNTHINRLATRAFVVAALYGYEAIESLVSLDVDFEGGVMAIKLHVKLKGDDEMLVIETTVGE